MSEQTPIDEPAPTVVGPRPRGQTPEVSREAREAVAVPGSRVPRGIERLLTLAGLSAEWRGKVLADPLAAADEAKIELSESERAILKSTPRGYLEQMADSLACSHGRPVLDKAAAGVAAAALLATGLAGCGDDMSAGSRSDVPRPRAGKLAGLLLAAGPLSPDEMLPVLGILAKQPPPKAAEPKPAEEAPAVQWLASLDDALAQAKKENRAVMAVFLFPPEKLPAPDPNRGISVEEASQTVCSSDSREFRLAVKGANLVAVKVAKPIPPFDAKAKTELTDKERGLLKDYQKRLAAYEAVLKKYGLDGDGKLPTVVFLAPDGSELSKLARPTEEAKLVEAIKAVPPQLAKWIADQRKPEPPAPPPSAGTRPPPPDWK